jgi:hypothetical protein
VIQSNGKCFIELNGKLPFYRDKLNKLPSQSEINVHGSLDERRACKNFLGKTLDDAEQLFRENSLFFQEDLKWMGPIAFCFYIEAAIAYVKSESFEGDADIISCLASTLELRLASNASELRNSAKVLEDFCDHVLNNWERYKIDPNEPPIATTLEHVGMPPDQIFPEWRLDLRSRYEKLLDRFRGT